MKNLMIKIKDLFVNNNVCHNQWFENYRHLYFKIDREIQPWYCAYK